MKYLKKYNSFNESTDTFSGYYDSECLKSRLHAYYQEQESEYDPEETSNVIDILNEYDDNLTGLNGLDKKLLLRLINDSDLYQEVDALSEKSYDDRNVFESTEDEEFQRMLEEEEEEEEEQFKKDKRMIRGVMTGCTCTKCDCEDCQEEGCTCDCCIPSDTFVCVGCGNICDINNSNSEYSNICHDCEPEEDK